VITAPDVFGLVLVGGHSTRMGRDKAALQYGDKPQAVAAFELVARGCSRTFLSCRRDQSPPHGLPGIHDVVDNIGPMGGIVSAFAAHPDKAWLVVACDLPFLTEATLRALMSRRDPARPATAFRSAYDGKPEPLCAIYEPSIADRLRERVARDEVCPRRALAELNALLLDLPDRRALDNVNHPGEYEEARKALGATMKVTVHYYAMLREQARRDVEQRETTASTAAELYADLSRLHGFTMPVANLRVAVNGAIVGMDAVLRDGDDVTFIPPVAGG